MASQNATVAAAARATPPLLVKGNQQGGELNCLFSTLANPAAGGVGIGEVITWGFLPFNSRVLFGWLTCSAGAASATLNLGDAATPARYLAASSITTAASIAILPALPNALGGAGFEVTNIAPGTATDHSEIRSVCAGAAVAANQTLTLLLFYTTNN